MTYDAIAKLYYYIYLQPKVGQHLLGVVVAQGVVVAHWGCGGSVVERQATNPVVPSSNPGQSLQYQKISWVL